MEGTLTENTGPDLLITDRQLPITMSSPWGVKQQVEVVPSSLHDIMSEQFIEQEEEQVKTNMSSRTDVDLDTLIAANALNDNDTSNDLMLARMLQMEYDKENNDQLKREEKHYNGKSKVSISFEKYRSNQSGCKEVEDEDDDDYIDEIDEAKTEWEQPPPTFKRSGISGKGKNITTKHDAVICGRRNASRLMDLPPEFETGDGEGMDMKLPNHVYNKLKVHSMSENKRSHRLHEKKEHSTAEHAIDPRTRLILYKMVNNGVLESISGTVSTGKESVIFHALGGKLGEHSLSEEIAIKVYKTTLNEFKTREKYVHGDFRFSKDEFKKQNPRKIISIWAEKETANLNRMKRCKIPCPHVQLVRKHCLLMSFIGKDQKPAPKLKDAVMSPADYEDAYSQVINIMKKLHRECNLVHADLNEYNMLWFNDQVWVIDVSQAVDKTHPKALEFLVRDCKNVSTFFKKNGVHQVKSAEELFNEITELNIHGEGGDFVAQVQRYDKEKRMELLAHQACTKEYPFDYFFDKSLQDRAEELKKLGFSDSEEDEDDGGDGVDQE
ncbi:hypothetical protein KUTeg_000378 [Tegillarca granosa]|uniref:Serine/threonine-protein kinase RIO3 n=1 Tax=Tegillarca granosa TaxID=220873 RepID=A0ABQ9FXC6_TEGGR|nr:hypothetical protein KUTeg_000378 [Tegillarca granosa]